MIPKIIHYCWFGRGQMPELAIKCIESWNKYLPDYELYLWNEDNFDINSIPYVKEAYESRKFAFVTDYVRLYALYNIGGIYMDTDVEVLKSLDDLLDLPAFSGFETQTDIPTGLMASEKHGKWALEMLDYYTDRHFIKPDGSLDMTSNVLIIGSLMAQNGFILKNGHQDYKGYMHMFPKDYFCPKERSGLLKITENTYCIHHFAGSWVNKSKAQKVKIFITKKILGPKMTDRGIKLKQFILSSLGIKRKKGTLKFLDKDNA